MHNLFGTRFVGMREPGWHQLGITVPGDKKISVTDAVILGGLDYTYADAPIGFTAPDGQFVNYEDKKVILRSPTFDDPTWAKMGIVGTDYQYLQNSELASGLDKIIDRTGWEFETVGALGAGETVFMTLKTGARSVKGDQYDNYLIVSDGKGSGRALSIAVAPVRVVCQNTLLAADSASTTAVKIPHAQGVGDDYAFWLAYVEKIEKTQELTFAELEKMTDRKISDSEAQGYFAKVFPMPDEIELADGHAEVLEGMDWTEEKKEATAKRHQAQIERRETLREFYQSRQEASFELFQRFNSGEEQGGRMELPVLRQVAGTPYAALQAATELIDWGGITNARTAAQAALFGDTARVKRRAWGEALKMS